LALLRAKNLEKVQSRSKIYDYGWGKPNPYKFGEAREGDISREEFSNSSSQRGTPKNRKDLLGGGTPDSRLGGGKHLGENTELGEKVPGGYRTEGGPTAYREFPKSKDRMCPGLMRNQPVQILFWPHAALLERGALEIV